MLSSERGNFESSPAKFNLNKTNEIKWKFSHLEHREVIEFLIQSGTNMNHVNQNGDTALTMAAGNGYLEIVKPNHLKYKINKCNSLS